MAILLMTAPIPAEPYRAALHALAPDVPVWTAEEDHDPLAVELLLAWQMKPGLATRYPRLRVVCSVGAGVDKLLAGIDLPAALPVTRSIDPGQHQQMAQYVVACTLAHTRELARYAVQQAQARWQRHPVRPAAQCRVGILGLGAVGQAIARAFVPLGYPVAGWSRSRQSLPDVQSFAGDAALPALLAQTDVLVCALPLTAATKGLLHRQHLRLLPQGAYIINLGRGEQLVEADLQALLDNGHLAGAALDVFEHEPPPPENWVWLHPKVRATPHIAGEVSRAVVAQQALEALQHARAGLPQPRAANRSSGY